MHSGVVGIGYERCCIEEFLDELRAQHIDIVVDARLIARSSRRGFSRNALAEHLGQVGISYVHYEVLGVPEHDQIGFGGDAAAVLATSARYRARLATPYVRAVISDLVAVSRRRRVAVLTVTADPDRCHRGTLLAEIARYTAAAGPIDEVLAEFPAPETRPSEPGAPGIEDQIDQLLAEVEASLTGADQVILSENRHRAPH